MVLTRPGVDDRVTLLPEESLSPRVEGNAESKTIRPEVCEKCALVEKLLKPEYCIYGSI